MNYFLVPGTIYYRTPYEIIDFISKAENISVDLIKSRYRRREIVLARQLSAYFISRKFPDKYSLSEIGTMIGYKTKDHASVIHSIKAITNLCETDAKFNERVNQMSLILETNGNNKSKN